MSVHRITRQDGTVHGRCVGVRAGGGMMAGVPRMFPAGSRRWPFTMRRRGDRPPFMQDWAHRLVDTRRARDPTT
jgi:hypothetical protein